MELTDEEKEDLKHIQEDIIDYYYSRRPNFDTLVDEDIWALENTLNLIEKQQKEIERLKKENKKIKENSNDIYVLYLKAKGRLREFLSEDELNRMECIGKYTSKYYIPKDAIREKIKENNKIINKCIKDEKDLLKD